MRTRPAKSCIFLALGWKGAEAIAELRVDVAELRGELEGLKGIMGRVEHTLSLLTEHHMKGE